MVDANEAEEADEVKMTMLKEQTKYKTDPKNQVMKCIFC